MDIEKKKASDYFYFLQFKKTRQAYGLITLPLRAYIPTILCNALKALGLSLSPCGRAGEQALSGQLRLKEPRGDQKARVTWGITQDPRSTPSPR